MFYYVLKYVILGPLLRLLFRPRIEGLEHIPEEGAAIVAGNHLSFSDHFLMPAILKRRITFLAKAEYFTGPGPQGPADRRLLPQRRADPGGPLRQGGGPGGDPRGARGAGQGRAAGHLPGGHPLARRPALQGQGRRRRDGAQGAGCRWCRARWSAPSRSSRPGRSCRGSSGSPSASASRWTSPATRGWRTRRRRSAPSPTRSCTRSSSSPARSTSTGTRPRSRRSRPSSAKKFPRRQTLTSGSALGERAWARRCRARA